MKIFTVDLRRVCLMMFVDKTAYKIIARQLWRWATKAVGGGFL